jgi:hypothetical protein
MGPAPGLYINVGIVTDCCLRNVKIVVFYRPAVYELAKDRWDTAKTSATGYGKIPAH